MRQLSVLVILGLAAHTVFADALRADFMEGSWTGAYFCYPDPIRIDASLSPDNGRLSGRVKLSALREGVTTQGEYTVSGYFDPLLRHLVLTAEEWVGQPGNQTFLLGFDGLVDADEARVGGNILTSSAGANLNCSSFVLGQRRDADDLLEQIIVPLQRYGRPANMRPNLLGQFRGGPDCDTFTDWFSRLDATYPELAARRYQGDHAAMMNLFDDEYFEGFFDDPFSEMSGRDRQRLVEDFTSCIRQNVATFNRYAGLQQVFSTTGQFSAPEISVGALARRAVLAWQVEMLDELEDMDPEEENLAGLLRLTSLVPNQLTRLWPQQRESTMALVDTTLGRIAEPVLVSNLESGLEDASTRDGAMALARWQMVNASALSHVPASARADYADRIAERMDTLLERLLSGDLNRTEGLEGAQELMSWTARNNQLLAAASSTFRAGADSRIDDRIAQLLQPGLAAEADKLERVGTGMAGVQAGAAWYRDFNDLYGFASNRAQVRDLLNRFWIDRNATLQSVEPLVGLQLLEAGTEQEVAQILSRTLQLTPDSDTSAGASIRSLAAARSYLIRRDAVIGAQPDVDNGVCGPGGRPPTARAPCEYEIYDALWRRFNAANQLVRGTRAGCEAREFQDPDNPLYAMACLGLWFGTSGFEADMSMTLTNVQKLGCEPREGYSGYMCSYIVGMRVSNNAAFDLLAQIPGMRQAIESGEVVTAYFEYGEPGIWQFYR